MPFTLAQARDQVKTDAAAGIDPTLSDAEIETILTATIRGTLWIANTAYAYGTRLVPTIRNGHIYVAVVGGTSHATTEPTWPTAARASLTDGTVTWQEAGPDGGAELYNLRAATYRAWQLKLAKASGYHDFSADGQSVSLQDVVTNIETNLRRWTPVGIS